MRQTHEDIPHLDGSSTTLAGSPAARPNVAPPKTAPPLDAALIDLLTARAVGERLSPEARAYLVIRRWQLENQRGPSAQGARFFKLGAPSPAPEDAAAMAPAFAQWAAANAPALPLQVSVSGRVNVEGNPERLPWDSMDCFGLSGFGDLRAQTADGQGRTDVVDTRNPTPLRSHRPERGGFGRPRRLQGDVPAP